MKNSYISILKRAILDNKALTAKNINWKKNTHNTFSAGELIKFFSWPRVNKAA